MAVGVLALGSWAHAQVTVQVVLDRKEFVPNESLVVAVRVTNRSGQKLSLGDNNDWLAFSVEALDGAVISQTSTPPVRGPFTIESSQVATKRVNLAPCFDLSVPRAYQVTATVKVWNQQFSSRPARFNIIRGSTLWSQEFGVPGSAGGKGPPEMRKYVLEEAAYPKSSRLYARVTDAEGTRVFRVVPIAPMVSFSHPEVQIDRASDLHVLHQTGARAFSYCVVDPNGQVLIRRIYEYTNTRPTLRVNRAGQIIVVGGARLVTAADIPQPHTSTNPSPPHQP
jgi:hypothetical protein